MTSRRGLRSRLFRAIGRHRRCSRVALTLGLGLVLTRRAVEDATAAGRRAPGRPDRRRASGRALAAHAPAATSARTSRASTSGTCYDRRRSCLASAAARGSRPGEPAQGTVTLGGDPNYFAAAAGGQPGVHPAPRPKSLTSSRWTPYVWGAPHRRRSRAGCSPRSPRSCSRARISRPVGRVAAAAPQPRARHASRAGAGRGRRRARDALASRSTTLAEQLAPRPGGGAELPALGQPRAEDAADRDPRLRRGGRGRRGRRARGRRPRRSPRRRAGSSASSATCSTSRA